MALVTTTSMLKKAQDEGYAVGAFNVENMEMVIAVIEAAEELNSPVILQTTPSTVKYAGLDYYLANAKVAAERVNIPVIVKLPPMIDEIGDFAKKLEEAGADAITACDSVGPAFRIDIETGQPLLGGNGIGYLSGETIKPITLQRIYEIKKQVNIPIIGLGGCVSGDDALEMIMAGADFVGICSVVILKGAQVISKIHDDLKSNLNRLGYNTIENACGIVHNHMGDVNERLSFEFTYDEEKCTKCKMCERVCAYQARKLNDKMELNEEECRYCGLCISVCKPKALGRKISCSELNV